MRRSARSAAVPGPPGQRDRLTVAAPCPTESVLSLPGATEQYDTVHGLGDDCGVEFEIATKSLHYCTVRNLCSVNFYPFWKGHTKYSYCTVPVSEAALLTLVQYTGCTVWYWRPVCNRNRKTQVGSDKAPDSRLPV